MVEIDVTTSLLDIDDALMPLCIPNGKLTLSLVLYGRIKTPRKKAYHDEASRLFLTITVAPMLLSAEDDCDAC